MGKAAHAQLILKRDAQRKGHSASARRGARDCSFGGLRRLLRIAAITLACALIMLLTSSPAATCTYDIVQAVLTHDVAIQTHAPWAIRVAHAQETADNLSATTHDADANAIGENVTDKVTTPANDPIEQSLETSGPSSQLSAASKDNNNTNTLDASAPAGEAVEERMEANASAAADSDNAAASDQTDVSKTETTGSKSAKEDSAEKGQRPEKGAQEALSESLRGDTASSSSSASDDVASSDAKPTLGSSASQDGISLAASLQDDALSIDVEGTQSPCTLTVKLARGAKLSAGIYLHASTVESLRPRCEGQDTFVEIGLLDAGQIVLDLASIGDGRFLIELLANGTQLQVETAPDDTAQGDQAAVMAAAAGQYKDFTFNGYYSVAATKHNIARIRAADWSCTGYCNDIMLNAPGDPAHGGPSQITYQLQAFSSDPNVARAQGQNLLDYIMYWGYPSDPTVGGHCTDSQTAEAATQWAIWHFTNVGSHPTWEASANSWPAEFWDAYNWLVGAAQDYDARCAAQGAQVMPEHGTCKLWVTGDPSLQNLLTSEPLTGWVTLAKSSDRPDLLGRDGYTLAGAQYQIRNAENRVVGTLTTDEQGRTFSVLAVGSYTLEEVKPPAGHKKSSKPIGFTITGGPVHVWVKTTDPAVLGNLSIVKQGGHEGGAAVTGAKFSLTNKRTGKSYNLTTDKKGKASTGWVLPLGTYVLKELSAPDGYSKMNDMEVQISAEQAQVTLKLVDPFNTTIKIQKLSEKTGKGLAGAKMQLLGSDGHVLREWTSTEGPHELRGIWPGTYTLREKVAPKGYERATDIRIDIKLTSKTQTYTMSDKRSPVPFSFFKRSLQGNALAGATFQLFVCNDASAFSKDIPTRAQQRNQALWKTVTTKTSGSNGLVDFGQLKEGVYLLVETEAPHGHARPKDGWLIRADSEKGVSVFTCGDGVAPAMTKMDGAWSVTNAPLRELPFAGDSGSSDQLAGAILVSLGVLSAGLVHLRFRKSS